MENTINNNNTKKQNNKEFIFFMVALSFFVLILISYVFFFLRSNRINQSNVKYVDVPRPDTDFYQLNPTTEVIEKVEEEPAETILTDLDFSSGGTWSMGLVLKGYFDSFNEQTDSFKIKNQLLDSKSLQLLELNSSHIDSFYCWPTTLPSANGPVDITKIDQGLSSRTATIYNPEERKVSLDQFDIFYKENIFVFVQLEEEYNIDKMNFIKKLILVGC